MLPLERDLKWFSPKYCNNSSSILTSARVSLILPFCKGSFDSKISETNNNHKFNHYNNYGKNQTNERDKKHLNHVTKQATFSPNFYNQSIKDIHIFQ